MKPTNYIQRTDSTVLSFPDKVQQRTVVKSEGSSYGKICDGAGNYKLSYEGEKPIKNFLLASLISVGRFVLKSAAATAVPIIITWSFKKMGIIRDKNDLQEKAELPNELLPPPLPGPKIRTLQEDVAQAAEQGRPENILTSEIHKDSRLIVFSGPGYNRKNEMSIFQKRNEQIFSFFASFFLWLFRPLKHQLNAD